MGRRLDLWLPSYLLGTAARARARRQRRDKTTHVFFLICDHYEPRHKTSRVNLGIIPSHAAVRTLLLAAAWQTGATAPARQNTLFTGGKIRTLGGYDWAEPSASRVRRFLLLGLGPVDKRGSQITG